MARSNKKPLAITVETLRTLSSATLAGVVGGADATNRPTASSCTMFPTCLRCVPQ